MEKTLAFSEAHIDLGGFSFLTHVTHEIKIHSRVIGHVMLTLYNFEEAANENTAWKWISGKDTYLENYASYLFDPESTMPKLPDSIAEEVIDSNIVVIIDEITLEPFFQGKRLESYILADLISLYEEKSDIIMLSGHEAFTERMGLSKELSAVLYCQLGFVWIDSFMGVKFKSIPMDDIEEISELVVNFNSYN